MKLKLDENLGSAVAQILEEAGHDVSTVVIQNLSGAVDRTVIDACRREGRCLVTLDLDFGNPLLFRHSQYSGVALIRLSSRVTAGELLDAVRTLAHALASGAIEGKLWIVQRNRVREYQASD